ncbi:MAG: hypothetical protein Q8P33_03240 [bacterium]|nr:hypothetical protein [bacterium]
MDLSFIKDFDLSNPSWDLFIILFFVAAAFIYGMSLGRDRIVVIMVSIYMALAVVNYAPYLGELSGTLGLEDIFVVRISAFVVTFLGLFFLLGRSALMRTIARNDDQGNILQVLVFSFLHIGLLISVALSFLPIELSAELAQLTRKFFVGDMARFFWVVAPILAMIILGRSPRNQSKVDE